jgi:hypothetical protein
VLQAAAPATASPTSGPPGSPPHTSTTTTPSIPPTTAPAPSLPLSLLPTPSTLTFDAWVKALVKHPDQDLVTLALHGIKHGAKLGYSGPRVSADAPNLKSATQHPAAVSADLEKELKAGRLAGPFDAPPSDPFRVAPLGTVPKKGSDEHRRIHHLSYPRGSSVNDWIDDIELTYASFDDAIALIRSLGPNALLAKVDVKAAFRCVAVHPTDRWLLGMRWCGSFFADLALPFGLKSSPGIWERYASLAEWILRSRGVQHTIHYVDDFLFGGKHGTAECEAAVTIALALFKELGIPVNLEKLRLEGLPSTTIKFLGILIDTALMQARLDPERLAAIRLALDAWASKTHCSLQELQSLIGLLAFAAKVVPAGRTFLRRLLATLHSAFSTSRRSVTLTPSFHADINWWRRFVGEWNGVAILPDPFWSAPGTSVPCGAPISELFTDACNTGFGAVWEAKWLHGAWSPEQLSAATRAKRLSMPFLELLAVAIALASFGPALRVRKISIRSDSQAVVAAIHSGSCPDAALMQLIRTILFTAATHQFAIRCIHIPGTSNTSADALSRGRVQDFTRLHPNHDSGPTPITLPPSQTW